MMRWLVVCALLAQTLAASRPDRAAWPQWMKMPTVDWPDWKMPTQDDLPEVNIPDIDWPEIPTIPAIPDIEIPEISLMPGADVLQGWRNPSQNSRNNGGQQSQSANSRGQGNGDRSHHGRWSWPTQYGNSRLGMGGETIRGGHPHSGRQQSRPSPQQGSSRGQWSKPTQNDRRIPTQSPETQYGNSRLGMGGETIRWPSHSGRQSSRPSPQQGSSRGQWSKPTQKDRRIPTQSNPRRPTQTIPRPPSKERKQRPEQREGPPQRRAPIRALPSGQQQPQAPRQTRPRTEPSMNQQVEGFRTGMPRWLQDELSDTFTSMEREIEQGRLQMDSWSEDIRTAAQRWWDRWSGSRNTESRRPSRPTGETQEETPRWQHPTSSRDRSQGRGSDRTQGRGGDRTSTRPSHHNPSSRGQSSYPSKGRKNEASPKWYNNTACRRPFRPPFERPTREEPEYKILCGGEDYEARLYSPSAWVSVTVQALTYDLALHKAYMKLYRYIHGHNNNGSEITRTVPVHTKVKSNARENRWFERHNYTISFYLPKDVHVNPPAPNDPQLFIEYEGATVYYAHTFRGYALEFNIWEYLDELTNTLLVSEEVYRTDDYVVNVYDAPWRLFNRRNEILVALDTDFIDVPTCQDPGVLTTEAPTTRITIPSTEVPTTKVPITQVPTTQVPTTQVPTTTKVPTTVVPSTETFATTITTAATTPKEPTTKSATTTKAPTIGELPPAKIEFPENPFDNNNLEQDKGYDCLAGSECPRYEAAITYDGFQLRHYAYSRWICMDQAACDIERAQKLTQGALLEYFYPQGNREQIPMEVTTPLVVGMDVTDLNNTDCGKVYTSCMFIPEEHQGAPPTPRDARLYLQDIPSMSRYVKPFGGYATSQNVPQRSIDFLMQLEDTKLMYDGSIVAVAQYTTSKNAKTRLNELWVMDQSLLLQGELQLQ